MEEEGRVQRQSKKEKIISEIQSLVDYAPYTSSFTATRAQTF